MRNKVTLLAQLPLAGGFAALALLLFAPETVHAQTDVFFACYVPSGVVYRVNAPDAPGEDPKLKDGCTGKKHVLFSWTDGVNAVRNGDAAAGDLDGTYPNPTVAKLQGNAVSTTTPTASQVLTWNGSAWEPQTLAAGTPAPGTVVQVVSMPLTVNLTPGGDNAWSGSLATFRSNRSLRTARFW